MIKNDEEEKTPAATNISCFRSSDYDQSGNTTRDEANRGSILMDLQCTRWPLLHLSPRQRSLIWYEIEISADGIFTREKTSTEDDSNLYEGGSLVHRQLMWFRVPLSFFWGERCRLREMLIEDIANRCLLVLLEPEMSYFFFGCCLLSFWTCWVSWSTRSLFFPWFTGYEWITVNEERVTAVGRVSDWWYPRFIGSNNILHVEINDNFSSCTVKRSFCTY